MPKLVVFGPFWCFFSISLDLDATNGRRGLTIIPGLWAGLHGYARGFSHLQHQMSLFNNNYKLCINYISINTLKLFYFFFF